MVEIGEGHQAIEYALENLDDHFDMRKFLNDWMHGDVENWPEYLRFLAEKPNKQSVTNVTSFDTNTGIVFTDEGVYVPNEYTKN